MNSTFVKSVNISPSYGNSSLKKQFFRKKKWGFIFFPKNNEFGKKWFMELQSLFKRAISLYFLFFDFRILKFDMWRHHLNNAFTRFRAYDRFLNPALQLQKMLNTFPANWKSINLKQKYPTSPTLCLKFSLNLISYCPR